LTQLLFLADHDIVHIKHADTH